MTNDKKLENAGAEKRVAKRLVRKRLPWRHRINRLSAQRRQAPQSATLSPAPASALGLVNMKNRPTGLPCLL